MAYRTLGTLRADLLTRLGFGASGAAAGVVTNNANNFLYSAQVQLYYAKDWDYLRAYYDKILGYDQYLIDYPTELDPERIYGVYTLVAGTWRPVKPGIRPEDYTYQSNRSWPQRYEKYSQIEIYPKADASYTVRVWGIKKLGSFTLDNDVCTVDDNLVFLHALASAKAHYRHPDAQIYMNQLESLLSQLKNKSWSQSVFPVGNSVSSDDQIPPVVI